MHVDLPQAKRTNGENKKRFSRLKLLYQNFIIFLCKKTGMSQICNLQCNLNMDHY